MAKSRLRLIQWKNLRTMDKDRQMKLQNLGVKFIRFFDVDVKKNLAGVLSALRDKIDEVVRTSP